MATRVDGPTTNPAGADRVPSQSRRLDGRRWGPSAFTLLLGGLLTAVGGWLRWWGPGRQPDLGIRENSTADPLNMGYSGHFAPGSGESVASGQLLVAIGLLLLLLLPWGRWARLIAAPMLVVGAGWVAFGPVLWIHWWSLGRPDSGSPVEWVSRPDGLGTPVGILVLAWVTGLIPLLLGGLAVLKASRPGRDRHVWRAMIAVSMLLFLSAPAVEFYVCYTLFTSDSHDSPEGVDVLSGLATAVAGGVLTWSGMRRRRRDAATAVTR